MNIKETVLLTARYIDEKKAEDIVVIDLNGQSSLCDYIIIGTVTSRPHLEAVEQETTTMLKQHNLFKTNRDGGESSMWRVSDYGGFMMHLMTKEAREFYALDKIFSFGKLVDWEEKKAAPKKKAAVKKTAAKKAEKKVPAKKAAVKKTTVKKTAVKKVAKTKTAVKKPAAKKAPAKKTTAKKVSTKKTTAVKTVKKTTVKKTVKKAVKKTTKKK